MTPIAHGFALIQREHVDVLPDLARALNDALSGLRARARLYVWPDEAAARWVVHVELGKDSPKDFALPY